MPKRSREPLTAARLAREIKRFKQFGQETPRQIRRRPFNRRAGFFGRFGPLSSNPELKFHDATLTAVPVTIAGVIFKAGSVIDISQGVGENQRIGRKITLRGIGFRFHSTIQATANSSLTNDIVRVIVYQDKQCNGAAAIVLDLLDTADFRSFNNLANKGRFRTLMDRSYTVNSGAGTDTGFSDTMVYDTWFKKLNIPMEFDSASSTISAIKSNNIGVLAISHSGLCNFGSRMRVRFSDQ